MLSTIREKTQGIIATFILILVVIPFALWGINSYFEGGPGTHVARVNGIEITQDAYRAAMEPLRGRVEAATLETRAFKELVVSGLVEQTLLVRDAEESGYRMGDERLARMIREVPLFQRDGKFDPEQYRALLRREGMTEQQFEGRLRNENITRQVQAGIVESAILVPGELDRVARLLAQEREIAYAVADVKQFLPRAKVSTEEIEKRYEAQGNRYLTAEQVRIQYLRLSAPELIGKYQPSEQEIARAYEEEVARYTTPAKRRVAHILIAAEGDAKAQEKARAQAGEIARQLQAGANFAALARKYSDDKDSGAKGGDLGEVRPGILPKALEAAVGGLKAGENSAPVRTEFGWHIAKVTAYTPEKRRSLAEVKAELVKHVRKRVAEERFAEAAEKFRNLVYEHPESLAPAANTLELSIQESGWLTRSGGAGIGANLKVVEAAFQPEVLAKTRNSDAIDADGQTLVAVRVLEHKPAVRRPLAEVRAEIESELKQEAALREAGTVTEKALAESRAGAALEGLVAKYGLKLERPRQVRREQTGVDRRILEAAFRARIPEGGKPSYERVEMGRSGYALVIVRKLIEPDAAKIDAATRERAKRLLAERRGNGQYNAYRAGLRLKAEVKVFSDRL